MGGENRAVRNLEARHVSPAPRLAVPPRGGPSPELPRSRGQVAPTGDLRVPRRCPHPSETGPGLGPRPLPLCVMSRKTLPVRQFHYMTWPDHGVPHSPDPLLDFWRMLRQWLDQTVGRGLRSCTAGEEGPDPRPAPRNPALGSLGDLRRRRRRPGRHAGDREKAWWCKLRMRMKMKDGKGGKKERRKGG